MPWIRGDQRNPAEPEPGPYAVKLVKKGPEVAAEIITAEINGEKWWSCIINNVEQLPPNPDPELHEGVQKVWLFGRKIDEQEYTFLLERYRWHKQHMPEHPFANPEKPIDLRLMPPIGG